MRILLVNPHDTAQGSFSNAPLGLAYLATAVRDAGHEVSVVDGYTDGFQGIVDKVQAFEPELVGITCYTPGRMKALQIAEWVKDWRPEALVILGGAHPSIMWRQILECYGYVDACVVGEGEQALVEIANAGTPIGVPGVAFVKDGQVQIGPRRENVPDIDDIPFPAWDLLELNRYPGGGNVVMDVRGSPVPLGQVRIPVVFSRGCPGGCSFCAPAGTMIRMADGRDVAIEHVKCGDAIETPGGAGIVTGDLCRWTDELFSVELASGRVLEVTGEHPVLTKNRGWVAVADLTGEDDVVELEDE